MIFDCHLEQDWRQATMCRRMALATTCRRGDIKEGKSLATACRLIINMIEHVV